MTSNLMVCQSCGALTSKGTACPHCGHVHERGRMDNNTIPSWILVALAVLVAGLAVYTLYVVFA